MSTVVMTKCRQVIIGVGVMAMLPLLAAGTMVNSDSTERTTAVHLVNSFNEKVMRSNFGAEGGTIIADKIVFDSNAAGTLNGSVITLSDQPLVMDGNANIQIQSRPGSLAGFRFTSSYKPKPSSYKEVRPQ